MNIFYCTFIRQIAQISLIKISLRINHLEELVIVYSYSKRMNEIKKVG